MLLSVISTVTQSFIRVSSAWHIGFDNKIANLDVATFSGIVGDSKINWFHKKLISIDVPNF